LAGGVVHCCVCVCCVGWAVPVRCIHNGTDPGLGQALSTNLNILNKRCCCESRTDKMHILVRIRIVSTPIPLAPVQTLRTCHNSRYARAQTPCYNWAGPCPWPLWTRFGQGSRRGRAYFWGTDPYGGCWGRPCRRKDFTNLC
jgi:hypothetical protein